MKKQNFVNCKNCKTACRLKGRDCDVECGAFVRRNQTHAEQIRAMDDAQLARYLWIESGRMTAEEWLDWLRMEVQE